MIHYSRLDDLCPASIYNLSFCEVANQRVILDCKFKEWRNQNRRNHRVWDLELASRLAYKSMGHMHPLIPWGWRWPSHWRFLLGRQGTMTCERQVNDFNGKYRHQKTMNFGDFGVLHCFATSKFTFGSHTWQFWGILLRSESIDAFSTTERLLSEVRSKKSCGNYPQVESEQRKRMNQT